MTFQYVSLLTRQIVHPDPFIVQTSRHKSILEQRVNRRGRWRVWQGEAVGLITVRKGRDEGYSPPGRYY